MVSEIVQDFLLACWFFDSIPGASFAAALAAGGIQSALAARLPPRPPPQIVSVVSGSAP
jgi:hypothetical protein